MARDQFLEACSKELFVHLKPKAFENLDAMAKEADLFAEARGGVFSCVNKGQRDNSKGTAQSKPESKPSGSNSDYDGENEQGTQIKSEESESSRGRGYTRGRGRGFFRGRGRTDGPMVHHVK